jgi:hypothetical protein
MGHAAAAHASAAMHNCRLDISAASRCAAGSAEAIDVRVSYSCVPLQCTPVVGSSSRTNQADAASPAQVPLAVNVPQPMALVAHCYSHCRGNPSPSHPDGSDAIT